MGERHTAWKGDTAWGWAQGRGPEPRREEGQEWANRRNTGGSGEHLRVCFRCPLTQSRVAEERAPQVGASPRVGVSGQTSRRRAFGGVAHRETAFNWTEDNPDGAGAGEPSMASETSGGGCISLGNPPSPEGRQRERGGLET